MKKRVTQPEVPVREFGVALCYFDEVKTIVIRAKAFTATNEGVLLFVDGDEQNAQAVAAFAAGVWIYVSPVQPL